MRFTLRQLELFLATARHENLSRAAAELSMSQSAASSALADLERRYATRLFDRAGRRLRLNETGAAIRARVNEIVSRAQELDGILEGAGEIGELRVGATLTVGNHVAVDIVAACLRAHPGMRIDLEIANTADISDAVVRFALDLALIEGEIAHPELDVLDWQGDELVVFCSPDHPLAGRAALSDADLVAERWILRESGSGTRQTFDRAMHGILGRIDLFLELGHAEAIKRAVASGLGIGCLSRLALANEFALGTLVPLAVPHRDLARRFHIVMRRDRHRSAAMEAFLAACLAHAEPVPSIGDARGVAPRSSGSDA